MTALRLWITIPDEPISDDRAYVCGYLKHVFDDVVVTAVARDAAESPPPARPPHAVFNLVSSRSRALLDSIEAHARAAGAALSPPTDAAWRTEDKRTYVEDFADLSPPTRIARTPDDVRAAYEAFGGDIVVKDPFGARGRGIERITSLDDLVIAEQVAANGIGPTRELVVQPFMQGFSNGDKRIITQKNPDGHVEIIAHFTRRPAPGDWKCNLSSGGELHLSDLTDAERALALEVAGRTGLDHTAMDLAEHDGRLYYIEHNHSAGGIIDHDVGRNERGVEKIGDFLRHIAEHGRTDDAVTTAVSSSAGRP